MTDRKALEDKILAEMEKIRQKMKHQARPPVEKGEIPYDKKAARTVIEKFLKDHPDRDRFMTDLKNKMDS